MTYKELENDKTICRFSTYSATIGSSWFKVFDDVEREVIYLGKITGKPIFAFPENLDKNKSVNDVMIFNRGPTYRYRKNKK